MRSRLDAIHAAVARAQELKLQVDVGEDGIKVTLRALLAGLPAVEGALRETRAVHSPGELREIAWRREGPAR